MALILPVGRKRVKRHPFFAKVVFFNFLIIFYLFHFNFVYHCINFIMFYTLGYSHLSVHLSVGMNGKVRYKFKKINRHLSLLGRLKHRLMPTSLGKSMAEFN